MRLELQYVIDQIIKKAALIYLIPISHSKKDKKCGTTSLKVLNTVFRTQCLMLYGGWGRIKHKKEEVTEEWKVLHNY